ncbi:sulfotransferase 1E1-like [Saccostrea echinata]|uniref:sulfotransferase 1E1-like n=1 Tax=Saccostrea echinata TaxID=191078 RepID=UPI002A7F3916|nr:sulfotransferase 1E1-like [Saccostrea echinata]
MTMAVDFCDIEIPDYEGLYLPKIPTFLKDPGHILTSIRNLTLGPDAIILATYPRSGTHWMYEMTEMLLKGKAEYCRKSRETAYLEGLSDLDSMQFYNRIVSTHVPFQWLPRKHVDGCGKIILVIRNPKDTAVSLFKIFDSGGYIKNKSFQDFVHEDFLGPKAMHGGWFEYNKEFLKQAATRKNEMIVITFEKLKKDTKGELLRLAKFLGVKEDEQLIKDIVDKCSFNKLKDADKVVREDNLMAETMRELSLKENVVVYRKGEAGDWKNYFTVALNEEFDKAYTERMKEIDFYPEYE